MAHIYGSYHMISLLIANNWRSLMTNEYQRQSQDIEAAGHGPGLKELSLIGYVQKIS